MPDRLAELRRQRALVAEHLAWLDREIGKAGKDAPGGDQPSVAPDSGPSVPENTSTPSATTKIDTPVVPDAPEVPDAAKILAGLDANAAPKPETAPDTIDPALQSEHRPADIKDDVRRGCFIYLAIATLIVAGGGALLIWIAREYNKNHPPKPKAEQVEDYQQ